MTGWLVMVIATGSSGATIAMIVVSAVVVAVVIIASVAPKSLAVGVHGEKKGQSETVESLQQ
jgi:hypothetical protein